MIENEFVNEIKKKTLDSYKDFRKMTRYLAADAPIAILCLPKTVEKLLINSDILRIYDLFDLDLTKIEGLTDTGVNVITTRLQNFISMG